MDRLVIRYEPDPDDEVGELWFDLRVGRFSGAGFCWSNLGEFPDLILKLGAYPLGRRVTERWGVEPPEGLGISHILSVEQVTASGKLDVTVEVSDNYAIGQGLRGRFPTDYASLDEFSRQLEVMRTARQGEAVLVASSN